TIQVCRSALISAATYCLLGGFLELMMPRPRERLCLEGGLKLDLNRLRQQGLVQPGSRTGPTAIHWSDGSIGDTLEMLRILLPRRRPVCRERSRRAAVGKDDSRQSSTAKRCRPSRRNPSA